MKNRKTPGSWETLTIRDRFIFANVMRDADLCRELLQMILPEIPIGRIEYLETEKSIEGAIDTHGVRLDVFAEDGEHSFEVEMQVRNDDDLPRRSRFNSAMLDEALHQRGVPYHEMKDTFVIFLCPFDPIGAGLYQYTFRYRCEEDDALRLGDGTTIIFLNAKGPEGRIPEQMQEFLAYVAGAAPLGTFSEKVEKAVSLAKMDGRLRREYMRWIDELENEKYFVRKEARAEGLAEGRAEGLKEGRAEGLKEGREEERKNTERERKRAEEAEARVRELEACLAELRK